ncbi:MAG: hypothetical protein CL678_13170 [Bdellovibrionaceae bacterium]|nr:hypothetical protein [Pseudobdellovibrionaceae bacterium]|tara:strand:- start:4025 stop:4570 length:546 start_codon:yes stop_codon:yes gene_type:complete
MLILKKIKHLGIILCLWGGTLQAGSLGAGVGMATPMTYYYNSFTQSLTFNAQYWQQFSFLPPSLSLHASILYTPLATRLSTNMSIHQIYGLVGVEAKPLIKFPLVPFASLDFGGLMSVSTFNDGTNSVLNFGGNFALQFRSGISYRIWSRLSAMIEIPILYVFHNPSYLALNTQLSFRWDF